MSDKITHFTQSQFELESFKKILVAIFPQIHFIEPNKRTLPHSILQSQTAICTPFKLGNKNFGIYIFECDSIRAKVGIHTELKSILKATGLSAILAIFHTPNSPPPPIRCVNLTMTKANQLNTHKKNFAYLSSLAVMILS